MSEQITLTPITILVVEDEAITRTSLGVGLSSKHEQLTILEAENGQQALDIIRQENPAVVLMDIRMPVMNGLETTKIIKQEFGDTVKVIMLTSSQEESEVYAAMTAGADAYCTKDIRMVRLLQVIEMVLEGALWVDPAIAKMISGVFPSLKPPKEAFEASKNKERYNPHMTERESDVLALLTEGKTNKEIALELNLSINTIKTHVRNIIDKMAVDSRTQVALKALQLKNS